MSRDRKGSALFLLRMIEACEKIRAYVKNTSEPEFLKKTESYDAICMQFSHMGEQVQGLLASSEGIVRHFPDDVDWPALRGLRNQIDHNYAAVEPARIWAFAVDEIEEIESSLRRILKKRFGRP